MTATTTIPSRGNLLRRLLTRTLKGAKQKIALSLQLLRRQLPAERRRWRTLREDRLRAENMMADFAQGSSEQFDGTVLIDGTFDNANYWFRTNMMRRALGTAHTREIGITGPFSAPEARQTFARLGIDRVLDLDSHAETVDRAQAKKIAQELIATTTSPDDVLTWKLPYDFPAMMLYDLVLKQQRMAFLDITDPLLLDRVTEILSRLVAAERLVVKTGPKLLFLSHVGPLAWVAAKHGIKSIVMWGHFGLIRFFKIVKPEDVFDPYEHPTGDEMEALPKSRADALAAVGLEYVRRRVRGKATDVGSRFAYKEDAMRLDRSWLIQHFGWNDNRTMIVVYAPNWFDYPHFLGMERFRDFHDWLVETIAVVREAKHANWLFKAHPADAFYGGITLKDLMPGKLAPHVQIVPDGWSSEDIMKLADGAVTYHGTAGVECAVLGKPVLVPDAGWYHHCGFVKWTTSRQDYLETLKQPWWESLDIDYCARRAQIMAGWFFASPTWQGDFVLNDDSHQGANYAGMPALLSENGAAVDQELAMLRSWFDADSHYYNTYKMALSDSYGLSNVKA